MENALLHDFYSITNSDFNENNSNNFSVQVHLNAKHPIYKGHFEQVPITPGVCQVQIIKEILMKYFQKNMLLSEGDSIKYLGMINPETLSDLTISFSVSPSADQMAVTASIAFEKTIFTKFKGNFKLL